MVSNPPAMGPHAEMRKAGIHHTDKTVEKEGGAGEGNNN